MLWNQGICGRYGNALKSRHCVRYSNAFVIIIFVGDLLQYFVMRGLM